VVAAEAADTTLRIESFRLTPVFGRVVVLLQRVLTWALSRVACAGFACALSRTLGRFSSFVLPSFLASFSSFLFLPFRFFLSYVPFLPLFPLLPFLSFRSFLSFPSFLFSCSASLSFWLFLPLNTFLSLPFCFSFPFVPPLLPSLPLALPSFLWLAVSLREGKAEREDGTMWKEGRKEERKKRSNASKTAIAIC